MFSIYRIEFARTKLSFALHNEMNWIWDGGGGKEMKRVDVDMAMQINTHISILRHIHCCNW